MRFRDPFESPAAQIRERGTAKVDLVPGAQICRLLGPFGWSIAPPPKDSPARQ
jgi:hypothetical protein